MAPRTSPGVTPESETVRKCTLSRKGAASGECKRSEVSRAGVLASCGGADEARGEYGDVGQGVGSGSAGAVPMARTAGPGETAGADARAGSSAGQGSRAVEAGLGGEGVGVGFFQRCLAQNRGATPGGRKHWREGIYDQIRGVMSVQGSLSVERMCQLAPVSRAGYYRSLQEQKPVEEDMAVRSGVERKGLGHRQRE